VIGLVVIRNLFDLGAERAEFGVLVPRCLCVNTTVV
jgi:hypothetical protein